MVMQTLDGEHSAAEAAAALVANGLNVSAGAVESFTRRLKGMGLCERTVSERSVLQMERLRAERGRRLRRGFGPFKGDLLRMRWSVADPDKLLDSWLPRLGFFFTPTFLRLSVALFLVYFLVLILKWPDFVATLSDFYNLRIDLITFAVFWLTGTIIIVIHELGHGFTCKYFGGKVHEIGVMLIYFELAFFCNVNDAWTFPERRARIWVTAAGSWIQLVIASLAAVVWWAAAPGTLVADAAFAGVFTGGILTVFMNANPLLPLDGYYALSDYLEVPNLRKRAFAHLGWLSKSKLLKLDVPAPVADDRERRVFVIYGGLAAIYVSLVLTFVAAAAFGWLSKWFGAVGIAAFMIAVFLSLRRPVQGLFRTVKEALRQHRGSVRWRSWKTRLIIGAAAIVVLGGIIPWRITLVAPFRVAPVLWMPHAAPDSGVVERVLVREGMSVSGGTPLVVIRNLELEREGVVTHRARDSLANLSARARGLGSMAEVALLDAQQAVEDARLSGIREKLEGLRIRALGSGIVVTPRPEELTGSWVSNGEAVLLLGRSDSVEIRIALSGAGATHVRPGSPVRLLPEATLTAALGGTVTSVSAAADQLDAQEARLRLPADGGWRPGMTGNASITLRQSNAWGALWWNLRRAVRSEILL
jgi:putative peptide zinc metalloprotease protein